MRLTRYLARLVLVRAAAALAVLSAVYAAIDLVEASSYMGENLDALHLYLFKLPLVLVHVSPLALLLGVQLCLAALRSRGEWDGIRSAGIGPRYLLWGFLMVPLVALPIYGMLVFHWAPAALSVWEKGLAAPSDGETFRWAQDGDRLEGYHPDGPRVQIQRDGTGQIKRWEGSAGGASDVYGWQSGSGWTRNPAPMEKPVVRHGEGGDLSPWILPGATLSPSELAAAVDTARHRGHDTAPLRAEQALRVALTAACFILPFWGLGLGLRTEEQRPTRLIGLGIGVAAAYWLCLATAWNGAMVGVWHPAWISAGVPGAFLCGGVAAIIRR